MEIPYWIDDELFPKERHRLVVTAGPDPLLAMGECSCGLYLYTGDNDAVFETFDRHAEDVQRAVRKTIGS